MDVVTDAKFTACTIHWLCRSPTLFALCFVFPVFCCWVRISELGPELVNGRSSSFLQEMVLRIFFVPLESFAF